MGRRGPAPTPTTERIHQGETRPSRINHEEPIPVGDPYQPYDLAPAAEAVWKRVVRDAPPGLLTSLDTDVLRLYCEAVARYVEAQTIYNRAPLVRRGWFWQWDEEKKADVRAPLWVKNPIHQVVRDNAEMIRLLARELGFTPSARVNLHVTVAASAALPFEAELGPPARLRLLRAGGPEID